MKSDGISSYHVHFPTAQTSAKALRNTKPPAVDATYKL
jgi:hypothetical protein